MCPHLIVLEPLSECFCLGLLSSWAFAFLLHCDPLSFFIVHVLCWFVLDWLLLCIVQVRLERLNWHWLLGWVLTFLLSFRMDPSRSTNSSFWWVLVCFSWACFWYAFPSHGGKIVLNSVCPGTDMPWWLSTCCITMYFCHLFMFDTFLMVSFHFRSEYVYFSRLFSSWPTMSKESEAKREAFATLSWPHRHFSQSSFNVVTSADNLTTGVLWSGYWRSCWGGGLTQPRPMPHAIDGDETYWGLDKQYWKESSIHGRKQKTFPILQRTYCS